VHAESLRKLSKDEALVRALRGDWRMAEITAREYAMLEYAWRLTVAPGAVQERDIAALRAEGFDDRAVLQINLITSWFNFLNRVADGLGVERTRRHEGA
jgi:uncharacterized peroxidase-related enzyme